MRGLLRDLARDTAIHVAEPILANSHALTDDEKEKLTDTEIEHSVVLDGSRITGIHRIQDSLVGKQVEVVRSEQRPRATRLMLGDHSIVDFE